MGAADSKLAFKKSVFRLFEERFWTLPESADDVFLLVGSQDIRRVRDEARENLECLVEKTLAHLFRLCESPQFLTPHAPAAQVLNCLRILTRIFPFVFESDELMNWEDRYFWTPQTVVVSTKRCVNSIPTFATMATTTSPAGAEVGIEVTANESEIQSVAPPSMTELEERSVPSYGQRLIKTLLDLLFSPGFTLPTARETKDRVSYVIWETGVGTSTPIGTSKELDDNRTEILRFLLVLFSRSMYIPPAAIATTKNHWIDTVVTGSDRKVTLALLCSLINSALKYNPSGWGLPYNHVMFSSQRELLVMHCLQVIVVLLDYQVIERPQSLHSSVAGIQINDQRNPEQDQKTGVAAAAACAPTSPLSPTAATTLDVTNKNQFRYYLSRLHREQDFMFLIDGMYRILSNPMAANSTYLPGSTKQVKCHQETLMFCWKTLELNKRFRTYLLETNRVLDIVVILLYFSLEHKQDPVHIGLVRMCACMLQTLSRDRAFGNCLNKHFDGHASLPANVRIHNFHGTYGDYLICSIHNLIATTKRTLRSLYPALISTLSNVSPFIKNLSPLASSRLLQLTTSFASPSFLLAEESNHELLGILLDSVCSIVYYQAPENPHLIYTLVQYEPKIQTMAKFTLQHGLDDIHKLRYYKEEVSNSLARSSTTNESEQPKSADGRYRRPMVSRHQSYQGALGESSNQQQPKWTHFVTKRKSCSNIMDTATASTSGSAPSQSSSQPNAAASASTSSSSHSLFPKRVEGFPSESNSTPIIPATLERLDSADSTIASPSDGGGHEGDVEDEGGPSTVLKSSKERSLYAMSEKARGKLPEKSHHRRQNSASTVREASSNEVERQEPATSRSRRSTSVSKSTAAASATQNRRPAFVTRTSTYRQEQATTAYDVGQNGFVPTDEWVQGWMRTLRFEPLLVMLQYAIPEIESIHAMTDHQVLQYIRTRIIPMLLEHILPESGRPPISTRKFVWTDTLIIWFQGLLWSQIFVGGGGRLGRQGMGAWYETGIKLFSIRTVVQPSSSAASAAATMTDNVASAAAAAIRAAGSTFTATSTPTSPVSTRATEASSVSHQHRQSSSDQHSQSQSRRSVSGPSSSQRA
ncbi:hypothetical protein BGZ51_006434 [Haplosporangium sp. Z 767]|nr:hypothetical protein BGZ51_006434 [Haplosporangium sp. Z 767]